MLHVLSQPASQPTVNRIKLPLDSISEQLNRTRDKILNRWNASPLIWILIRHHQTCTPCLLDSARSALASAEYHLSFILDIQLQLLSFVFIISQFVYLDDVRNSDNRAKCVSFLRASCRFGRLERPGKGKRKDGRKGEEKKTIKTNQ